MKLGIVVNSKVALDEFLKKDLPIGMSWDVKVLIQKLNPELTSYEDLRMDLIKKYGEQKEGTDQIQVKIENLKVFFEELAVLQEKEIEVLLPEVKVSKLRKIEGFKMNTDDLLQLDWLIKE